MNYIKNTSRIQPGLKAKMFIPVLNSQSGCHSILLAASMISLRTLSVVVFPHEGGGFQSNETLCFLYSTLFCVISIQYFHIAVKFYKRFKLFSSVQSNELIEQQLAVQQLLCRLTGYMVLCLNSEGSWICMEPEHNTWRYYSGLKGTGSLIFLVIFLFTVNILLRIC